MVFRAVASPDLQAAHPYYHFHGFAGDQVAGDAYFFDKAAGNHADPGPDLSNAALWGTAGYASTVDPALNTEDSVLRIPAVNFDYSGGEKLIVWALGKWTPDGAENIAMMGDGYGTTAGQHGWAIRVPTTGKLQPILYGAAAGFGGSSVVTAFDGTLHSIGVVLDGSAKKYALWVDDTLEAAFGSGYLSFNSGTDADTTTSNTVNIGQTPPASANSTLGMATAIRACVIIRLPASYAVPTVASITAAFKQLRANPGKLLLASAF